MIELLFADCGTPYVIRDATPEDVHLPVVLGHSLDDSTDIFGDRTVEVPEEVVTSYAQGVLAWAY